MTEVLGSGKVDAAIATVTKGVKRLAKEERNPHGGYNFAGIDDFLEMTGKLCGAAGLNVLMDELEMDVLADFFTRKSGKVAGLKMRFAIWLKCEGEKDGPWHRSIIIPADMGSQAFGAAQSYVLKQFLRATFQIPTGDKGEDIDNHDTGTMAPSGPIDAEQLAFLHSEIERTKSDEAAFCRYLKVPSLNLLPVGKYDAAVAGLKRKDSK